MKKLLFILIFAVLCGSVSAQQPAVVSVVKSETVQTIDGVIYFLHTVQTKQTLYSLSKVYDVDMGQIIADNSVIAERGLQIGMIIKIRAKSQPAEEIPVIVSDSTVEQSESTATKQTELPITPPVIDFAPFHRQSEVREIALMLPLSSGGVQANNAGSLIELYQGVLIALAESKERGIELNLSLYDTERAAEKVSQLLNSYNFVHPDIIIGPVYEEQIALVATYAITEGITIVSPLSTTDRTFGTNFYQLAPDMKSRFDKLRGILTEDKNIVFITTDSNDAEMENGIKAMLGSIPHKKVVWDRRLSSASKIEDAFSTDKENIFVVTCANEVGSDMIMAQLSSIQTRFLVKSGKRITMQVIGSPRWAKYENMDKNLLFKLNVSYITAYYNAADDTAYQQFVSRYVTAFNQLPTQYSVRGYDAVRCFVSPYLPLGTYEFIPLNGNSTNINWTLVSYASDFSIVSK